eukprot:2131414-Amphidinium_carterae.2
MTRCKGDCITLDVGHHFYINAAMIDAYHNHGVESLTTQKSLQIGTRNGMTTEYAVETIHTYQFMVTTF